jgi:hypothetical protein
MYNFKIHTVAIMYNFKISEYSSDEKDKEAADLFEALTVKLGVTGITNVVYTEEAPVRPEGGKTYYVNFVTVKSLDSYTTEGLVKFLGKIPPSDFEREALSMGWVEVQSPELSEVGCPKHYRLYPDEASNDREVIIDNRRFWG